MSQLEVTSCEPAGGHQLGASWRSPARRQLEVTSWVVSLLEAVLHSVQLLQLLHLLDILDIGIKIRLSLTMTVSKITICAIYSVHLFIYFYGCEINDGIIYV